MFLRKIRKVLLVKFIVLVFVSGVFAQLEFPRLSPKAEIKQVIGDTTVSIQYGRPNIRQRKVWGELVPFGQVWRTGANEATVFEVSGDVSINGQKLPAGKYSLHTIPGETEWTIIFNRVWDQWGSFDYDEKADALRVTVKPLTADKYLETLAYSFEDVEVSSANVVIGWENLRIPFKIDIGDILERTFDKSRAALIADPINSAAFVFIAKLKDKYADAVRWLDNSVALSPSFAALSLKAQILAEMGRIDEAIEAGEKALAFGKSSNPPVRTGNFESLVKKWKTEK
jgi:hypothetical protein